MMVYPRGRSNRTIDRLACFVGLAIVSIPFLSGQGFAEAIPFEVSTSQPVTMLGTVVRDGRRWRVHSIWLEWDEADFRMQHCKIRATRRYNGGADRGRIELQLGSVQSLKGKWKLEVRLDEVDSERCAGVVMIPPDAGDWRNFFTKLDGDEQDLPGERKSSQVIDLVGGQAAPQPKLIRQTVPRYSDEAVRANVGGNNLMMFVVRSDGSVDPNLIRVLRYLGYGLDEAAIEEVLNVWKFEAARAEDGTAVAAYAVIEMSFEIRGPGHE